MNTSSICEALSGLTTAIIADALDAIGYRTQCLGPSIRSLGAAGQVSGRVFTAKVEPVSEVPSSPYRLEMAAVDRMSEGDVLVVDGAHHQESAFWGELLSTACVAKGVRGVVMSACCRDINQVKRLDFPVFGIGTCPADSLGRIDVTEIERPIRIDGVKISPGDWILGDSDGVVVIPAGALAEVLVRAEKKQKAESGVRTDLANGMPVSEAFRKHRIL